MNQKEVEDLIRRYNKGLCTEREKALLEIWYAQWNHEVEPGISDDLLLGDLLLNRKVTLSIVQTTVPHFRIWRRVAAVAALVIIFFGAGLLYFKDKRSAVPASVYANDIAPGKAGATLILASGKRIALADAASGELAKEAGLVIRKSADGKLVYEFNGNTDGSWGFNTLSTAKGETYQVRLPDGSMVWLNAASSLKYATDLGHQEQRKVFLEGEAYFEVVKDKAHPFVVQTRDQQVLVLGTHFNINGYSDEPVIKTTLLEGSVKVVQGGAVKILSPGEQIVNSGRNMVLNKADVQLAVAWKNNEFMFESESIENIMRMVERWYNVEVIYRGEKPTEKFGGGVSRFDKVSKVLQLLERTGGAHFKLEGNKIYVSK